MTQSQYFPCDASLLSGTQYEYIRKESHRWWCQGIRYCLYGECYEESRETQKCGSLLWRLQHVIAVEGSDVTLMGVHISILILARFFQKWNPIQPHHKTLEVRFIDPDSPMFMLPPVCIIPRRHKGAGGHRWSAVSGARDIQRKGTVPINYTVFPLYLWYCFCLFYFEKILVPSTFCMYVFMAQ